MPCPVERATARSREAIAIDEDNIGVTFALRDALLYNLEAFIHQREERSVDNFLCQNVAPCPAYGCRVPHDERIDVRINYGSPPCGVVVPATLRLLSKSSTLNERICQPPQ